MVIDRMREENDQLKANMRKTVNDSNSLILRYSMELKEIKGINNVRKLGSFTKSTSVFDKVSKNKDERENF